MILSEDKPDTKYQIRAYQPGVITINEQTYYTSVVVTNDKMISDWPPQSLAELTAQQLEPVFALKADIILLGTGTQFRRLPTDITQKLQTANISIECMDTGAACRTFTALTAEGRYVAAALLIE